MNSSQVSYFLLGAYENLGAYSYLLFTLVLLFYLLIVASNLLLTAVICLNRSLHQPISSPTFTPSRPTFCFLQIFCVHSYGGVEFMTLAAMASVETPSTRSTVVLTLWSSCPAPAAPPSNAYGLVATFSVVVGCLLVIGYSYLRILQVCSSGSRRTRQKAVSTCSPHLASLLNFSIGVAFETVQSRLDMQHLPNPAARGSVALLPHLPAAPQPRHLRPEDVQTPAARVKGRSLRWSLICCSDSVPSRAGVSTGPPSVFTTAAGPGAHQPPLSWSRTGPGAADLT
ncbi:unnamed protein product [Tetraodon nigroviridis]|uniref:(spotted green pufferfish) hypothetical protein n=1 Tax=Tetraodon nigroviridis TaxID=99883 RepID=Q4SB28_TETNG|nr:unnamed protein product [Tetraodon nigroviridis]